MTRAIRWTLRALRRLDQAAAYIAEDDPQAAERVVARLISGVELLSDQPAMGRAGRIKGTRELVFADVPYIIPYRITPTAIEILTVMHSSQNWPDSL
jgi:addiction module RelE/StbE family toxin